MQFLASCSQYSVAILRKYGITLFWSMYYFNILYQNANVNITVILHDRPLKCNKIYTVKH